MSKSSRQRLRHKRKSAQPRPSLAIPAAPEPFPIGPSAQRWTAVACLVGAQYIHWSVIDVHAAEWAAAGMFFTAVAIAEGLLAFGVGFSRDRRWLWLTIVINLLTVAVWAVSRTTGLPFGPSAGQPEPLGRGDSIATILELLAIAAVVPLLRTLVPAPNPSPPSPRQLAPTPPPRRYYVLVTAMAVYVVALTGFAVAPALSGSQNHGGGSQEAAPETPGRPTDTTETSSADEPPPVDSDAVLVTKALAFNRDRVELLADRPVQVRLTNDDSARHNFALYLPPAAAPVFRGELVDVNTTETYSFQAPAPGAYEFRCDLHPQMKGVAEFRRAGDADDPPSATRQASG